MKVNARGTKRQPTGREEESNHEPTGTEDSCCCCYVSTCLCALYKRVTEGIDRFRRAQGKSNSIWEATAVKWSSPANKIHLAYFVHNKRERRRSTWYNVGT